MSADTLTPDGTPVLIPLFGGSDTPITYTAISGADELAVAYQSGPGIEVVGYDLAGNQLFTETGPGGGGLSGVQSFNLAPAGGAGFVMAQDTSTFIGGTGLVYSGAYQLIDAAGHTIAHGAQASAYGFTAFSAPDGAHLEWNAIGPDDPNSGNPSSYTFAEQDVSSTGAAGPLTTGSSGYGPQEILPYASTAIGSLGDLTITDNQAQLADQAAVTLPGEPANAVTDVAAAGLADFPGAAVAWVDSGTDYVSIFSAVTDSFGPRIGLDWGGASNLHVVALPAGGFVVSWRNGGAYKGEVFDSNGNGGGILSLAGDVAGIDGHGDLYTVGLSGGQYAVQTYAIQGNGIESASLTLANGDYVTALVTPPVAGLPELKVQLHAPNGADIGPQYQVFGPGIGGFKAPVIAALSDGGYVVETVINQTHESTLKAYEFSASGSETGTATVVDYTGMFPERADQYAISGLPDGGFATAWTQDLSNSDPTGGVFVQEYGPGNVALGGPQQIGTASPAAQTPLIAVSGESYTVSWTGPDGPHSASFTEQGGASGGGGSGSSVSTSDANYTAPDGVTTITLTGSHQTIHANNAGDAIFSNDTGNVLYGGTGNDTFHMGRGGDWAQGGGGGDTFAFAAIPWAAGGITDFGAGDTLDLGGLLATTQDIPAGGFSDGYLQLTDDGAGDTQVWARYATSGADSNWWLVTTLDGITIASLDAHHTVVTVAPNAHQVTTAAADYVAPDYITSIVLSGSQQHIDASATQFVTIASNDTGNVLIGGAGNDSFYLGRGGDWVTGGAGADTFNYLAIPWAAGGVTDFNAGEGDKIDVSRLLAQASYTGADPFADGVLKYGTDGGGNAQLWANYEQPGNDGWWLVATLDGVSTSSLHYSGGLIT